MIIKEFQGDHRWLSNFWPCRCYLYGELFPSTEHAYQASKLNVITQWKEFLQFTSHAMTPGESKKLIRKLAPPHASREESLDIMRSVLRHKFDKHINPELHCKLKMTCDAELIEGNYWGDKYWGVCLKTNVGENMLGKILMDIRSTL